MRRSAIASQPIETRTGRHQRGIRPPAIAGQKGAPKIYDPVRFPHIAEQLSADYGFTQKQLAKVFGVSYETVLDWVKLYPEFKESIRKGRDAFDVEKVESALLKRALGYSYEETSIINTFVKGVDAEGNKIRIPAKRVTKTIKEVAPDPKSCMFWLTNRNRERWKIEASVNANVKGVVEHKHSGVVATAQLENLNDAQLLALRDMVAAQSSNAPAQIEHNPAAVDMSEIYATAAALQQEMYGEIEDGEYSEVE